jgi:SPP1 family predicted phage head-tail adaptor
MADFTPRGKIRTRITFCSPTPARDEYGQDVPGWTDIQTCWAYVKSLTGQNLALLQADTITTTATHQICIRYNGSLQTVINRIRIGQEFSFFDMTDDEYEALSDAQFNSMNDTASPPPRYLTINSVHDVDEAKRELRFLATEIMV